MGLFYGLGYGLSDDPTNRLRDGLVEGLSYGLSFGVAVFLLHAILDGSGKTPRLAEQISWNWCALFHYRHLRASLFIMSILACFFGLSSSLSFALGRGQGSWLGDGLAIGLGFGSSIGLGYWLLFGLYQGMDQKHLEEQDRRHFNQGLHRSLRNGLLLSVLGGGLLIGISLLSYGLSDALIFALSYAPNDVLKYGLGFALKEVLIFALSYAPNDALSMVQGYEWLLFLSGWFVLWASIGGLTILRYSILRAQLARSHTFPLHARCFLDDAVARVLLKRQWGGYAFIHRRLLDYCADTAGKPSEKEKQV